MQLSDDLQISVSVALTEAGRRRHEFAGLEHLLLALTLDAQTAEVLRHSGADLDRLKAELESYLDDATRRDGAQGPEVRFGLIGDVGIEIVQPEERRLVPMVPIPVQAPIGDLRGHPIGLPGRVGGVGVVGFPDAILIRPTISVLIKIPACVPAGPLSVGRTQFPVFANGEVSDDDDAETLEFGDVRGPHLRRVADDDVVVGQRGDPSASVVTVETLGLSETLSRGLMPVIAR